jgi:multidrug efflux pump subunit AcrA (membrane-fusion protein)
MIILLVILVASGGTFYTSAMQSDEDEQTSSSSDTATQTAVARQGDLVVFASGTGKLVPQDETTLKFDENGMLVELLVDVGVLVASGDVLARLQTDKSEAQLAADIAKAELAVIENQQALDAFYEEAEIKAAQALFNMEVAQEELVDLRNNDLEVAQAMQAVSNAEAAIEDAEMALYIHNSKPSEDDVYTAYASLLFKEKTFNELIEKIERLEYEYKKAKGKDARERVNAQIERTTAQMYNAQIAYEEALYHYETIDDPADPLDLNLAQTQMDTAQARLDQAKLDLADALRGASAGDIDLAEAKVSEIQDELERWQDGPDPQEIVLAETRLETSLLNLQLARQESLIIEMIAPIDGTVMEINAAVNQAIDGDPILTLADTNQLLIEVYLDEADLQSAQVGNRVEVIFDALPDRIFTGLLVDTYPGLERVSNSWVVQGLAILDEKVFPILSSLPVGLNASVEVIAGETRDAVLVPIEALHETSPGNFIIYVQNNQGFDPREVTVGLMNYTSVEIISGLEVGEVVALGELNER